MSSSANCRDCPTDYYQHPIFTVYRFDSPAPAPLPPPPPPPKPAPVPIPIPIPAPQPLPTGCKPTNLVAPTSALEQRLLSSQEPVTTNETQVITANGITGIHANANETAQWRSREGRTVADYQFLNDPNPIVVRRRGQEKIRHIQEVEVKFLKPPQPPTPPPIQIIREGDTQAEQAPPIVIVQPGRVGDDAAAIVLRERPPKPPAPVAPKEIRLPGKKLPAAPRRVIVEKLPDLPGKPAKIHIERWLGYERQQRRVIYEKLQDECPANTEQNIVVEWEQPDVEVHREYKCVGVEEVDPDEYSRKYTDLKEGIALNDIGTCNPGPYRFATDQVGELTPQLYGDVDILKGLNLAELGLSEYRSQL